MTKVLTDNANYTGIAGAIRSKLGVQTTYTPAQMAAAIGSIPTGGGSTLGTKTITQNGTYNASSDSLDGYSQVTVDVPSGGGTDVIIPIIVSANSTFPSSPKQAYQAFGDVAGNFWGSNSKGPNYIEITPTESIAITAIKFANYYRLNSSTYWHSSNVTFRGSNDGWQTYTDLYVGTGLAQGETQISVDLNNATEYASYRFVCSDSTAYAGLGRIELLTE